MKRTVFQWMWLLLLLGMAQACQPQQTEPSAELTPTPIPPTPTPVAQMDYRVTSLEVAQASTEAIDINGDGKADNGLEKALKEISKFLTGQINVLIADAVESGMITEQQAAGIKAAAIAGVSAILSVQTVNQALKNFVEEGVMLEMIEPVGDGVTQVGYWTGATALGGYSVSSPIGNLLGTYAHDTEAIDARGDKLTLSITLGDTTSTPLDYDMEMWQCRTVETYSETKLFQAKLAGAISIQSLIELVDELFKKLGLMPFIDKESLAELHADLEKTLSAMSDVTLTTGDEAISVSMIYNADATVVTTASVSEE